MFPMCPSIKPLQPPALKFNHFPCNILKKTRAFSPNSFLLSFFFFSFLLSLCLPSNSFQPACLSAFLLSFLSSFFTLVIPFVFLFPTLLFFFSWFHVISVMKNRSQLMELYRICTQMKGYMHIMMDCCILFNKRILKTTWMSINMGRVE